MFHLFKKPEPDISENEMLEYYTLYLRSRSWPSSKFNIGVLSRLMSLNDANKSNLIFLKSCDRLLRENNEHSVN